MGSIPSPLQCGVLWVPILQLDGMGAFPCSWLNADDGAVISLQIGCVCCTKPLVAEDRFNEHLGEMTCSLFCPICRPGVPVAVSVHAKASLFEFLSEAISKGIFVPVDAHLISRDVDPLSLETPDQDRPVVIPIRGLQMKTWVDHATKNHQAL